MSDEGSQARPTNGSTGSGRSGASGTSGRRSVSPGLIILVIALIGTIVFGVYVATVRDNSQIPLLAAGGVALGIVFIALAGYALRATWIAGTEARNAQAILLGIGGGIAGMIGAGCIAGAIILFLLSRPPA
jgi:hypothetical protein